MLDLLRRLYGQTEVKTARHQSRGFSETAATGTSQISLTEDDFFQIGDDLRAIAL